ncbi:glycosyltransferase family 2 protein [Tenuifilum thalassicum]|uniref:Glycosyltransferase family 2 protein n=1 Tax=Tenuifilum thalassicum TaxID=2590900 RepID=A0A7D4BKC4_9BACT|nr:glycosyltransferase [Tenuifilum thalassicum]QKG80119.1 glycosyltransferase family 2 protein [Tenuifilum thalassicum]
MISFYVVLPFVLFACVRFFVVLFNYLSQPYLQSFPVKTQTFISVLIPALNKENNILYLLSNLQVQSYSHFEVIIYGFLTDSAKQTVKNFVQSDKRFQIVYCEETSDERLNKNKAYQELANRAKGEYFLFIDPSARITKNVIENSISYIQYKKLDLLLFFPYQILGSLAEAISVPFMQWVLLSLNPLKFMSLRKLILLFETNSQMILLSADFFRDHFQEMLQNKSWKKIKTNQKKIKRLKFKAEVLLGLPSDIRCRMYPNPADAINGVSENIFQLFSQNHYFMIGLAAFTTIGPILVLTFLPFPLIFVYFFSVLMARILVADLSKHSIIKTVLLFPFQQIAFLLMVIKWERNQKKVKLIWKGRKII